MKKTIYRIGLMMAMLLYSVLAYSQEFNNEGMTYRVVSTEESTVMIYKAHRCVQEFSVPYRVKDYMGNYYRVTEIEHDAFRYLSCLYVLNLGEVKKLRDGYLRQYEDGAVDYFGSFANCSNLKEVRFGKLKEVGDYAFSGCKRLTYLNLSQVELIGESAFRDCTSMDSVCLGEKVKQVKSGAFAGIEQLRRLRVQPGVPPVCADDAFSESVYQSVVLEVPAGTVADYRMAEGWKKFLHIAEESVTAVEDVPMEGTEVKVTASDGTILVKGATAGTLVAVCDAGGRVLAQKRSSGDVVRFRMAKGKVYWVKAGQRSVTGVRL